MMKALNFILLGLISFQTLALPSQPPSACVATSMYYLLKVAPDFSNTLQKIPGTFEEEKLKSLNEIAIETQGEPKDLFMGLEFTKKEEFASKVLSLLSIKDTATQLIPLQRDSSEVLPTQFSNRVFELLKDSLDQGFPVMAGLRLQLVQGGSVGHTVLITEVKNSEGFAFEIVFLNPLSGESERLTVEEELSQDFEAYIFDIEDLTPRWSQNHLFVINDSKMISSPFLKLKGKVQKSFGLSTEIAGIPYLEEILLLQDLNALSE